MAHGGRGSAAAARPLTAGQGCAAACGPPTDRLMGGEPDATARLWGWWGRRGLGGRGGGRGGRGGVGGAAEGDIGGGGGAHTRGAGGGAAIGVGGGRGRALAGLATVVCGGGGILQVRRRSWWGGRATGGGGGHDPVSQPAHSQPGSIYLGVIKPPAPPHGSAGCGATHRSGRTAACWGSCPTSRRRTRCSRCCCCCPGYATRPEGREPRPQTGPKSPAHPCTSGSSLTHPCTAMHGNQEPARVSSEPQGGRRGLTGDACMHAESSLCESLLSSCCHMAWRHGGGHGTDLGGRGAWRCSVGAVPPGPARKAPRQAPPRDRRPAPDTHPPTPHTRPTAAAPPSHGASSV